LISSDAGFFIPFAATSLPQMPASLVLAVRSQKLEIEKGLSAKFEEHHNLTFCQEIDNALWGIRLLNNLNTMV